MCTIFLINHHRTQCHFVTGCVFLIPVLPVIYMITNMSVCDIIVALYFLCSRFSWQALYENLRERAEPFEVIIVMCDFSCLNCQLRLNP